MLEALYSNKNQILKKTLEFFQNSSSLIPKIGCELEFFLLPQNKQKTEEFISILTKNLLPKFPLFYQIEKERGEGQIEVKTTFTADLVRLCRELELAKTFITKLAQKNDLLASFAAQPFENDCGSALQFNISLHDQGDNNLFVGDKIFVQKIASRLLSSTNQIMIFLAPQNEDYLRFAFQTNYNLFKNGKIGAPVNLSFGGDNRTCAIRIPAKEKLQRLEYRIAAANADPWLCIAAILLAIHFPAQDYFFDFKQIYGNAFDEQYQLPKLCQSASQAKEIFLSEENFLRKKFNEFLK